jgi:hypothetical protein
MIDVEDEHGGASTARRAWCYVLPPLAEARAHFELIVGQKVHWPLDEDDAGARAMPRSLV